jgi:type II secretory pathway predicted ATPase ExeA
MALIGWSDRRAAGVWISHWGLARDPFAELGFPYVSLPSHDEAVARVVNGVETGQPLIVVRGGLGLGKTTVLRQSIGQLRGPARRFVIVSDPLDGTLLLGRLAERLSARIGRDPTFAHAKKSLERAVQVLCLEGFQVILAIDDCRSVPNGAESLEPELIALERLALRSSGGVTIIEVQREVPDLPVIGGACWTPASGLKPLTRSQAEHFLLQKLAAAGCRENVFTPRAFTRLQCLSGGVPRGLERLAALCLTAGATRGLEVISPEFVDEVARDFLAEMT